MNDSNWYDFSATPSIRFDKSSSWIGGPNEVNGAGDLTYWGYLQLSQLLSAQTPGTRIPDERIFIITHQLCELSFKQMLFDLEVLSETFRNTMPIAREKGFEGIQSLEMDFWRPALTAAGRLEYFARHVLPAAVGCLAYNSDPTFDSSEFGLFREKLIPASGFQSAQFRAVQAALGKRNLLDLQMYPSAFYKLHYRAKEESSAVSPSDPLIVQTEISFGSPADDLLQELLGIIGAAYSTEDTKMLQTADFLPAVTKLRKGISSLKSSVHLKAAFGDGDPVAVMVEVFGKSVERVVIVENERREMFMGAYEGYEILMRKAPTSPLVSIIRLIRATDKVLHGTNRNSFLSLHRRFVGRRIKEVNYYSTSSGKAKQTPGTGGGGLPYLELMHKHLIPLFPGLVSLQ